jgi:SAM-dependent methyltransferase
MSVEVRRPLLRPAPLESIGTLVEMLSDCTGDSREVAVSRLLREARCTGVNVREEADRFGLVPHVWSDRLIEFYRTSTGFAYETVVWNHCQLKCSIRRWIGTFLNRTLSPPGRVLIYGDGLGFDSVFLAAEGWDVTSLEPSDRGRRFAAGVFRLNNIGVRQVEQDDELPVEPFDAIVCLDVLEHVPSPPETLAAFRKRLKPDGLLIVSAPFHCIEPYRPTHLRSNRKYSGDLALFRRQGFEPLAGDCLWAPLAFRNGPAGSLRETALLRLGQPLMITGRWLWPLHSQIARQLLRVDRDWLAGIIALQVPAATNVVAERRREVCG